MSSSAVYCPKCGMQGAEGARFCRRCGTNLEAVSQALTGQLVGPSPESVATDMEVAYAKEYSRAVYALLGSVVTFLVLLFVFQGAWWVYFVLFWVANNVRDLVQATLLKRQITNPVAFQAALEAYQEERAGKKKKKKKKDEKAEIESGYQPVSLPPPTPSGSYVPPARSTGELEKPRDFVFDPDNPPPSVTEGTTRLLDDESDEANRRPDSVAESQNRAR